LSAWLGNAAALNNFVSVAPIKIYIISAFHNVVGKDYLCVLDSLERLENPWVVYQMSMPLVCYFYKLYLCISTSYQVLESLENIYDYQGKMGNNGYFRLEHDRYWSKGLKDILKKDYL